MSVQSVVVRGQSQVGPIDGRQPRVIEVTGTLTNGASAPLVVHDYEVELGMDFGASRVVVPGSATPFTLAPGASATWKVVKPARLLLGDQPTADARITGWSWLDAGLATACPV